MSRAGHFDSARFSAWMTRYMESEGLTVAGLGEKTGLSVGLIYAFRDGTTSQKRRSGGGYDPPASSLAKLAEALGLDVPFLLAKAGIEGGPRVTRFSRREQSLMFASLGLALAQYPKVFTPEQRDMLNALQSEILTQIQDPN